ncbi:MAG TPA: DUF4199 domain-containing protein [Gammaproteobacteria bacterium]
MTPSYDQNLAGSVSIWPTVWKFALFLAAFKAIFSLVSQIPGIAGTPGLGLISFVVAIVLLVLAFKDFRRRNHGHVTFGQGFVIAFVASIVSTVVSAAVTAIYFATVGRGQLAAQRESTMSQVQANPGVDAQTAEMLRGFFEGVFTPGGIFLSAAIAGLIGWCIVSLILAAVLKRPPPITA